MRWLRLMIQLPRRFAPTGDHLHRNAQSNHSSDGYFSPNTANPGIRYSARHIPRLDTGSSNSSKQARTMRNRPGALNPSLQHAPSIQQLHGSTCSSIPPPPSGTSSYWKRLRHSVGLNAGRFTPTSPDTVASSGFRGPDPVEAADAQGTESVASSTPWMMPGVNDLEALARNVRVYLGGGDIAMPEQHLDHAQVRAVVEEMGRERMP